MGNRVADQVLEELPEDKLVLFSHSNCHALKDHSRNARDEQMKSVYRRRGINSKTFSGSFHKQGGVGSVDTLLDHIDHDRKLGISESSAFASDYYGLYPPSGVPDLLDVTTVYPLIEKNLLVRDYGQYLIDGIMFEHGERVLRIVFANREPVKLAS